MIDIKSIIYKFNDSSLIININNESTIEYNNTIRPIDNELVIEYAFNLHRLIKDWKNEYVDYSLIDGNSWSLIIIYNNETKKEYNGKSAFPQNFEALKMLNNKLISEVLYE